VGPGQALDTLRTHVSQLRRKLAERPGAPALVTAPGVGYRLLDAPARELDEMPTATEA
jgi:DNA-binding response OmpR family regulator